MATKEAYIEDIRGKVRESNRSGEHSMPEDDYARFLRTALKRYSRDVPRKLVAEITGTDSKYYTVNATNLPNFVEGFSSILSLEAISAVIASNETPRHIERDSWDFYRDTVGLRIFFKNHQPTSSDIIRVEYTALHTINGLDSETVDTIPILDMEAIIYWGVSEALQALANRFANIGDPTIRADVTNYRSKSREYSQRAEEYRNLYKEWISEPEKAVAVTRDIDWGLSIGDSQPFLTHRSYTRN